MSDEPMIPEGPGRKKAYEIQCGNAVIVDLEGDSVVCMKAEREGKEYIHHYVVQLHPAPEAGSTLIYIDPDQEVVDCATSLTFTVREADADAAPGVGDVFRNFQGTFMKVHEDPKSQKMFAYLNLETGQVQRRQEKKLEAVYREWSADGAAESVTLVSLIERHAGG